MTSILEWFRDGLENKSDPRTNDWFLMSSPVPTVVIVGLYIYFCSSAGPRFMKNRKPYSLKKTLIVYNFLQVLLSIYLLYEGLANGWLNDYSLRCQPVDYSNNPRAIRMARAVHLYFLSKLSELLDTVFFVFRKNERQISFLHLYHHGGMPLAAWFGAKFVPGGHPTLMGTINAFVHVIMYSYYLLSALGPQVQKYLWWKRYVTILQLLQFVIVFVHSVHTFLTDCAFPKPLSMILIVNAIIFMYMFGSFYVETYKKDQAKEKLRKEALANGTTNKKSD